MSPSSRCLAFVLAAFAAAMPASADEPPSIARLKDLHGNVLVSKSSGLAAGGEGTRLAEGVRVSVIPPPRRAVDNMRQSSLALVLLHIDVGLEAVENIHQRLDGRPHRCMPRIRRLG